MTRRLQRPSMTVKRLRIHNRNSLALMTQLSGGPVAVVEPQPEKRKRATPRRQPETLSIDVVKEWAKIRGGVLYKNPRGVAGYMPPEMPVGLGPDGFPDLCGYLPITISQDMVGRTIAVATFIEVKRVKLRGKQLEAEPHQQDQIDKIAAAGGITGTARTAHDADQIRYAWLRERAREKGDER